MTIDDFFAAPKTSIPVTNGVSKPKSSPLDDEDDDDIFPSAPSLNKAKKEKRANLTSSLLDDPDDIFGDIKPNAPPGKTRAKMAEPDDIFDDIRPKARAKMAEPDDIFDDIIPKAPLGKTKEENEDPDDIFADMKPKAPGRSQVSNGFLDEDDDIFKPAVKKTMTKKKDEFLDILDDDDEDIFAVKRPRDKTENKAKGASPKPSNGPIPKKDKLTAKNNQSIFGDDDDDIFK